MQNGTRLAAVDLGSNSFRLEIGRYDHGQFVRSEYLKETVRQGGGLDADRNLTPEAMQRGWDCLARFGERIAGFQIGEVRAVATQTLREARNRDEFLATATAVLGFPIDVISGREEARLIYQGVAHSLPQSDEKRLVIDIGGRSTELILGQGFTPRVMESYRVGSIAWSTRYFPEGKFTARAFEMAEIAAQAVLDEVRSVYPRDAWSTAYGSAGTVGAVVDVLIAAGWPAGRITREGLDWLMDRLLKAQSADKLRIDGMRDDRRAIIGGGLSILRALFDLFELNEMEQATGGLRHGLINDLMERALDQTDLRSASIDRLAIKFAVDAQQATRVGAVAIQLFTQLAGREGEQAERGQRKLAWAAQLHEIGLRISHSEYHKHGAYILEHADAMGFALTEMHHLGQLVLGHRGKLRKLDVQLNDLGFVSQLLALRVAVILCHARRDPDTAGLNLSVCPDQDDCFVLSCRSGWPESFPQSAHLLREEVEAWSKTPWTLRLKNV